MKNSFRENQIFVLQYPIYLCVNAKCNTLYLSVLIVKALLLCKDLLI